jgi:hypothetical protein
MADIEGANEVDVFRCVRAHDKNCRAKLHRSGMDGRYSRRGESRYVDFTIAHVTCASHVRTSVKHILDEKISEKVVRYGNRVPQGEMVVALATSSGYIHDDFTRLLGWMAVGNSEVMGPLVDRVRAKVIAVGGAAIHAAWNAVLTGDRSDWAV